MMNALRNTLALAALAAGLTITTVAHAGLDVLKNGQTINGMRGPKNSVWVGRIYVAKGARRLVVATSGGQGDCDLYLRSERGANRHWDFRSQSTGSNEKLLIDRPKPGWWQVGLLAPSAYYGVSLHVRVADNAHGHATHRPVPPVVVTRPPEPNPHAQCDCGCKGDRNEHERRRAARHRRRRTTRPLRDEFEPNSKPDMAMQIYEGRPQAHTINPDGDEDWIMFVPRGAGKYVLEITDVTVDLEGQLYIQVGRHSEKRFDRFKVRRGQTAAIELAAAESVGYFKILVEAEDNDDVGAYKLNVRLVRASGHGKPHGPHGKNPHGKKPHGKNPKGYGHARRPDVYESDNRSERPAGIKVNSPQLHTIFPKDDEDWLLFEPTARGLYLLSITDPASKLKGELYVKRDNDKERRVEKFEISRNGGTVRMFADHRVKYFKIKIEAEDNDDTGFYSVSVVADRVHTTPRPRPKRPIIVVPPRTRTDSRDHRGHDHRTTVPSPRTGRARTGLGDLISILLK
jgi:hypothetical protein